jgi:hypothetical protein
MSGPMVPAPITAICFGKRAVGAVQQRVEELAIDRFLLVHDFLPFHNSHL